MTALRNFVVAGLAALAACTPRPTIASLPVAAPEPAAVRRLIAATAPAGPHRATFAWSLDEAGERFSGRGVARFVAPDRVRLDLFGPRGETYLAAALVGDSLRLPPQARGDFDLPSPALLWGALGIARPPAGGRAIGLGATAPDTTLQFATTDDQIWEFRISADGLGSVRRARGRSALETVDVERRDNGVIRSARYRNWAAFRTLDLVFDSFDESEPFPASIWLDASGQ